MKNNLSHMALKIIEGQNRAPSEISITVFDSVYGPVLAAFDAQHLCYMAFVKKGAEAEIMTRIRKTFPNAIINDVGKSGNEKSILQIQAMMEGRGAGYKIPVLLKGPQFYLRAWQALIKTKPGEVLTYRELAAQAGNARAARAIGQAMALNPLCYLVPCHRVLPADRSIGNYAWGSDLKEKMLEDEAEYAN